MPVILLITFFLVMCMNGKVKMSKDGDAQTCIIKRSGKLLLPWDTGQLKYCDNFSNGSY